MFYGRENVSYKGKVVYGITYMLEIYVEGWRELIGIRLRYVSRAFSSSVPFEDDLLLSLHKIFVGVDHLVMG